MTLQTSEPNRLAKLMMKDGRDCMEIDIQIAAQMRLLTNSIRELTISVNNLKMEQEVPNDDLPVFLRKQAE